ncbi:MAG: hypothetical protein QW652_07450 [Candidatus Nitrosotenuis sp.]
MTADEHFELGFQFRCDGKYELAKEELKRALTLDPIHLKARLQLALIKGFEGDFDGSLEDLRTLATENPESVDTRFEFGMTLAMLGYMEEACHEFREVLRLDPSHEKAKQQMAYCQ